MAFLRIFKKKEERRILKLEDLNQWLDRFVETKELGTTLGILKRELNSKTKKMDELLNQLEATHVKDPSVYPERALGVMDGNKKAYIQKIRNFLSEIKFPESYEDTGPFLEELSDKIEQLAADTQKNYFILKEFMENEVKAIANKISELDKVVAKGREQIQGTALDQVKEIKRKIEEYYKTEQEIYNLRKKAEAIESAKLDLYDKRSKIEEKIEKIKSGSGYNEYQKLLEKRDSLKDEIKNVETELRSMFSDIVPALKKYHNKFKEKLAEAYVIDAVKAGLEDEANKITDIIKKLEKNIDELEIKPQKLKRIKGAIKRISPDELKSIKKKIQELREEHELVQKRIKNHSVKLNLKEQEAYIMSIDKDLEAEAKKMEEIENELERRSLKLIKQKISELVVKLDKNIEIQK